MLQNNNLFVTWLFPDFSKTINHSHNLSKTCVNLCQPVRRCYIGDKFKPAEFATTLFNTPKLKFSRHYNYRQQHFHQLARNIFTLAPESCAKSKKVHLNCKLCVSNKNVSTVLQKRRISGTLSWEMDALVYWFSHSLLPIEKYCNYSKGSWTILLSYLSPSTTSLQGSVVRSVGEKERKIERESRETEGEERELLALVAKRADEAGQALTVTRDVVARPCAVHTLWAWLAAAVPVETRRANCHGARDRNKTERTTEIWNES